MWKACVYVCILWYVCVCIYVNILSLCVCILVYIMQCVCVWGCVCVTCWQHLVLLLCTCVQGIGKCIVKFVLGENKFSVIHHVFFTCTSSLRSCEPSSKHVGMSIGMVFKPVLFRQPYCWYFISTVFLWYLVGVISQEACYAGSLTLRIFLPPCLQCLDYWWLLCWEET